jgi:hypothetical protein
MEVEDELQNLQSLVGGRIEVMSIHTKDNRSIDFIFNEEGKFLFEKPNKLLLFKNGLFDAILGNIIVVAADEETGEFTSLTDEEIEEYSTFLLDDILLL